jgi:hypothetical protein
MTDTLDEIARIARVWPAVERLVAEARQGMWNSSMTCDLILAGYLGIESRTPKLSEIRDVLDATEVTHDGVRLDKAIKTQERQ